MRQFLVLTLAVMFLGACGVGEEGDAPAAAIRSGITEIFRETWDVLSPGYVGGQNGWSGNCVVVDGTNRYLKCASGATASKYAGYHGAGSYQMLVDLGPNANVVDGTIGKISLDGPQGRAFQIPFGCNNVREAFRMNGPVANLITFPCGTVTSASPKPPLRVICNWSTGGYNLSCGASWLPNDPSPATYVNLALPSPMPAFDTVNFTSYALSGAALFDKVYIWQM